MGRFRFWRRIRILPWVYLNFSKTGVSLSLGPRGATWTLGRRGVRKTVGIPGTGLFYTSHSGRKKGKKKGTVADELIKLNELRESGGITDEEYEKMKVKIMGDVK